MGREKGDAWVVVLELNDMLRVQSAKALLEGEGIEAEVLSLQNSVYPSLNRYRLMVRAQREGQARKILKMRGDE